MRLIIILSLLLNSLAAFAGTAVPVTPPNPKAATNISDSTNFNPKVLGDDNVLDIRPYQKNSLITLDPTDFRIDSVTNDTINVVVSAHLKKTNLSVLFREKYILAESENKKDFTVMIAIPRKHNTIAINLTIVDSVGQIKNEKFWVHYTNEELNARDKYERDARNHWTVAVGANSVNYTETGSSYSALNITGKLGYDYHFKNNWAVKADSSLSLLPITKSSDAAMRVFDGNALVGYIFPSTNSWSVSFYGGAYFLTTFVSDQSYGFENVYGPEFLLNLKKNYTNTALNFYIKYSFVNDKAQITPTANRQVSGGASYDFPLMNRSLTLGLDISDTQLPIFNESVDLKNYGLSLGLHF